MIKGLKFSYGSETHIISRLAGEIKNLVVNNLRGSDKVFSIESQCWGNDMLMSATGNTRNREFGILIGEGYTAERALEKMKKENKTVEGINTVRAVKKIMKQCKYKPPLLYGTSKIILGKKSARKSILHLMKSNQI